MRKALNLFKLQSELQLRRNASALEQAVLRPPKAASILYCSPSINFIGLRRAYCEIQDIHCWKCETIRKRKNQFFCESCGSLQDADKKCNYFTLLSLKNEFKVNANELTTQFRQLQNVLHPDKYSNRTQREQTNSLEWSSLVNKAYKTLSVPIDRSEYILELQGITLPEDNSVLDKEFLMEMMEKNEEVEDATKENILELLDSVRNELSDSAMELDKYFGQNNSEKAKFILIRMKYLRSLENSIKEKAIRLGVVK